MTSSRFNWGVDVATRPSKSNRLRGGVMARCDVRRVDHTKSRGPAAGGVGGIPVLAFVTAFVLTFATQAAHAEIVVAQIAAFTGPQAAVGQGLNVGIKLYLDHVNEMGGVNGQTIRLVAVDDGYKADLTAGVAEKVIAAEDPIALIGVQGTANNEALLKAKVLATHRIPLIGPRSGSLTLQDNPFIFHVRASYRSETRRMVDALTATGVNQIAVVFQDDGLGKDGLGGVEEALKEHALAAVATVGFERNSVKVEAAVAAMIKKSPQAIIFVGVIGPAAEFIKRYRAGGGTAQVMGLDLIDVDPLVKLAGVNNARGVVITQVVPSPERIAIPIVKEMHLYMDKKGAKGAPITYVTVEGYVSAKVLVEALRRAAPKPTRASLLRALETMGDYDAGGYYISYAVGRHAGSSYSELGVVGKDGKLHL
jgi:branched-chain amino acid transport system substrate-binding protein